MIKTDMKMPQKRFILFFILFVIGDTQQEFINYLLERGSGK